MYAKFTNQTLPEEGLEETKAVKIYDIVFHRHPNLREIGFISLGDKHGNVSSVECISAIIPMYTVFKEKDYFLIENRGNSKIIKPIKHGVPPEFSKDFIDEIKSEVLELSKKEIKELLMMGIAIYGLQSLIEPYMKRATKLIFDAIQFLQTHTASECERCESLKYHVFGLLDQVHDYCGYIDEKLKVVSYFERKDIAYFGVELNRNILLVYTNLIYELLGGEETNYWLNHYLDRFMHLMVDLINENGQIKERVLRCIEVLQEYIHENDRLRRKEKLLRCMGSVDVELSNWKPIEGLWGLQQVWDHASHKPVQKEKIDKIDLPLLRYYVQETGVTAFSGCNLLLMVHLLEDFIPFINTIEACGGNPEDIVVVGIPYSTKKEVIEDLVKRGYLVFTPESFQLNEAFPLGNTVKIALVEMMNRCKKSGNKFIIIEDGGYIVPFMHYQVKDALRLCIGAVEQTPNGIWRDRELERKHILRVPVLNVADSDLKKTIESPYIGEAVARNLIDLLGDEYIKGKKALVIGYGNIGKEVAENIKNDYIVSVYDKDKKAMIAARMKEYLTGPLSELIKHNNIVIGTSGATTITLDQILAAPNGTFFASTSSKIIEIDVNRLNKLCCSKINHRWGTEFELVNKRRFNLLFDGQPINFFGKSVPKKVIDIVLTMLFLGGVNLTQKYFSPRKIHVNPVNEQEIADIFYKIHFGDDC